MRKLFAQFAGRQAHPLVQFIKYGICGAGATLVDILVFYLLAWKLIPALGLEDPVVQLFGLQVEAIDDALRSRHFIFDKAIAFVFSNLFAYVTNVLWVFQSGRHGRHKEILLFYAVSTMSFIVATFIGWFLIHTFHFQTTIAYAANVAASVLINYAGRKFLIFKG